MKKYFKLILLIILSVLILAPVKAMILHNKLHRADNFESRGGRCTIFKNRYRCKGNGMAGAYGAIANDLSSIYWNPAGLANVKAMGAEFSYTSWFAGFTHAFAAFSFAPGGEFYECFKCNFV